MPLISDKELMNMGRTIDNLQNTVDRKNAAIEKATALNKFMVLGEGIGGAAAFGFLRGKLEDPTTGAWNIPNTTIDVELAVVGVLAAAAIMGVYYKPLIPYANHAANLAAGIGGHYAGQVSRKMGRGGKFSMIAGVPGIGALPQYDPNSYDPTQFSAPYSDPVAASLASSGV